MMLKQTRIMMLKHSYMTRMVNTFVHFISHLNEYRARGCSLCLSSLLFISIIIVLISVLGSGQASALELGASPPELVLAGKAGQLVCANVSIESDRALRVMFEERWVRGNLSAGAIERPLIEGKELGFSTALPSSVELEYDTQQKGNKDRWRAGVPVCIVGERSGTYQGVLLIMPEEGIAGVGVMMRVHLEGADREEQTQEAIALRQAGEAADSSMAFLLIEEVLGLLLVGGALRQVYRRSAVGTSKQGAQGDGHGNNTLTVLTEGL